MKETGQLRSLQVHLFDMKTAQHMLGNQTGLTCGSGVWVKQPAARGQTWLWLALTSATAGPCQSAEKGTIVEPPFWLVFL